MKLARFMCVLSVVAFATQGSAQPSPTPFGLHEARGVKTFWFDGSDVLVTGETSGVVVRHRDGTTWRLPGINPAVSGIGQGQDIEVIAVRRDHIARLRDRHWQTVRVDTQGAPEGVVLADNGEAMAWSGFTRLLFHISPNNYVTPVPLEGLRPKAVLRINGEFVVVVNATNNAPEHVLMRYEGGRLVPHALGAAASAEARCRNPSGAAILGDGSVLLHQRRSLCRVGLDGSVSVLGIGQLFGDDMQRIQAVRVHANVVFLLDSSGDLHSLPTDAFANPPATPPIASRIMDTSWRSRGPLFIDAASGTAALFGSTDTPVESFAGTGRDGQSHGGAWVSQIDAEEEEAEPRRRGIGRILPTGRLGFGGLATLSPDGPGSFAFDLVGGVRLLFWDRGKHPVIGAEFGYSRRGGDLDTNDLLLTLMGGYTSAAFGVQVAESLVFTLGESRSGLGLRNALRITTGYDIVGVEIAHGMEFSSDRHELRIMLNIDLGQLIVIGSLFRWANRATR